MRLFAPDAAQGSILLREEWCAVFRHGVDVAIRSIFNACKTSASMCPTTRAQGESIEELSVSVAKNLGMP
jgi:hypothetical protein